MTVRELRLAESDKGVRREGDRAAAIRAVTVGERVAAPAAWAVTLAKELQIHAAEREPPIRAVATEALRERRG